MTTKEAKKLFMSRVKKLPGDDACWLSQPASDRCGNVSSIRNFLGVGTRISRQAYVLLKGPFPKHLHVLHTCDNPPCVNPAHLWLGTHQDNMEDKRQKKRTNPVIGERNGRCIITTDIVRYIRKFYKSGRSGRGRSGNKFELAKKFGISHVQVYFIATCRSWRHIK